MGGRYEDLTLPAGPDPLASILAQLPPDTGRDVYRLTLTGESEPVDLDRLQNALSGRFFHLQLRDRTVPPRDLWEGAGGDSLEGRYFQILQQAAQKRHRAGGRGPVPGGSHQPPDSGGQEVTLP